MKRQLTLVAILLVALVLSSCRENKPKTDGTSGSISVTIPVAAPRTIIEGCPSSELEDWYEKNFFNMQGFVDEAELRSRTADNDQRDQMDFVLDRLVSLRNTINNAPTPTCVEVRHQTIVDTMQFIIDQFQKFANAEISAEDLESAVSSDLETLKQTINLLPSEVDPLMQIDPTTPTFEPSPTP